MRISTVAWIATALVLALLIAPTTASSGGGCAGCTLAISLIEQFATARKAKISDAMGTLCKYIGNINKDVGQICSLATLFIADSIQKDFNNKVTPEVTCATTFKMCKDFPNCRLFSKWPLAEPQPVTPVLAESNVEFSKDADFDTLLAQMLHRSVTAKASVEAQPEAALPFDETRLELVKTVLHTDHPLTQMLEKIAVLIARRLGLAPSELAEATPAPKSPAQLRAAASESASRLLDRLRRAGFDLGNLDTSRFATKINEEPVQNLEVQGNVVDHLPAVDVDGDRFSTEPTLRGVDWRGRDCDDKNNATYPGRRFRTAATADNAIDHNCNGILGEDASGDDYETKFCRSVPQYGVISVGDSATAHFAIPPEWLTASKINENTFSNLVRTLLNEADWPQCSSTTGHPSTSGCPNSTVPFSSLYDFVRQRNLCSHRDYQNIGVNGGSSRNVFPKIVTTLARNQTADHPALVFYALIGNDVCGKSSNPDDMTSVAEFTENTKKVLDYLDSTLPAGSHVFMSGLVDGRILFNAMQNKTHPIGASYPALYDYLNCLQTSPCAGWMNTDPAVRDATTKRAAELSAVYPTLVQNAHYTHIHPYYIPLMDLMEEVVKEWSDRGGDKAALIELTDGFHPSTTAQRLLANKVWWYVNNKLGVQIPSNPFNKQIAEIFGNQGGY